MADSFFRQEIKEVSFYVLFGISMTVLLPLVLGFGVGAFEESFVGGRPLEFGDVLTTYIIYYIMITAGLIGLPVLKLREVFVTSRKDGITRQKKPDLFGVAILHDPEKDGALYNLFDALGFKRKNPMGWSRSILRVFVVASLVFGVVGLLQTVNPQAQFVSIPQLSFQVTPASEVLFTAEPAAFAETTLMILVLSLLVGFNAFLTSKFKFPKVFFWFINFVFISPFVGFLWMGFHLLVYGSSETALFATFLFGWLGSSLTLLFGTFIFWYAWHFWNNIFAALRKVVDHNEDIIFVAVVGFVLLFVVWVLVEISLAGRGSKEEG